jgi:hypothetical protein
VFAGASIGALLTWAREGRGRLHVQIALAGLAIVWFGFYAASRPSIYAQSSFWTSSPTYFAIRVGVMMVAFAALFALEQVMQRFGIGLPALERFGRRSLFVYWIHVELVYGYATWPIRARLPLWGVGVAYLLFTALIYGAVVAFDRWRLAKPQIALQNKAHAV